MENYDGNDNNSEEEFEKKELKKSEIKSIKRKRIIVDTEDKSSIISALTDFILDLNTLQNIITIISQENLMFFNILVDKNDMKINVLLAKIYLIILSKEYIYKTFIPSIKDTSNYKIEILLTLIHNISKVLKKLDKFMFSPEIFELKKKSLGLLNFLYNNCKNRLNNNDDSLVEMVELIDILTNQYYSKAFNEMVKSKEIFKILESQSEESIQKFEQKISQINNYFEQFEIFKKFVEVNSNINFENKFEIKNNMINFYEKFGILLIKFCTYHNYIFLNQSESEIPVINKNIYEEENEIINLQENKEKIKVLFLIDKMLKYDNDNKEDLQYLNKRQKIKNSLANQRYRSSLNTKSYIDSIQKIIAFYLNDLIPSIEENPKIKPIKENLSYFLDSLRVESYFPLYLDNFKEININDNFAQSYVTNVFPGEENRFYFDTKFKGDVLIYIEFYLNDRTKDINFELNIYDNKNNKFKPIYKEEGAEETIKFIVRTNGYSIYEIVFDNTYSWFTDKMVNFKVSFLLPINDDNDEVMEDTEDYFVINREKFYYENNINIVKNIPVIINLNNLITVTVKENKKNEIIYKENKEDEKIISKFFFNYVLSSYFQKIKFSNKNQLVIPILSQNKNLAKNNKDFEKLIRKCNNKDEEKFVNYIGFCPDKQINNFNAIYKIYNIDDQLVMNHRLLKYKKIQENKPKEKNKQKIITKPLLLIHINNNILSTILFNKGQFHTKYLLPDSKVINFMDIDINKEGEIYDLIKSVNDNISDIEFIFCADNNIEKNEFDIKQKIKIYCQVSVNPPIPFYEYNIDDTTKNIINFFLKTN